jgi:hypothetical protein
VSDFDFADVEVEPVWLPWSWGTVAVNWTGLQVVSPLSVVPITVKV